MRGKADRPIEILLVEDNPGDVRLIEEAARDARLCVALNVATDGVQAIAYLLREGRYASARRPALVILDLNLPRKDGREVLAEIKGNEQLRRIPVVVLTSSAEEVEITRAYDLHANCYITKPVDYFRFMEIIERIKEFWLTIVELPSDGGR